MARDQDSSVLPRKSALIAVITRPVCASRKKIFILRISAETF
jgi:hypothetical protein